MTFVRCLDLSIHEKAEFEDLMLQTLYPLPALFLTHILRLGYLQPVPSPSLTLYICNFVHQHGLLAPSPPQLR